MKCDSSSRKSMDKDFWSYLSREGSGQLVLKLEETVEMDLPLGTYVSMAVQMLDGLIPAFRKVMAKFLALLLSNRVVLVGAFLDGLFSLVRSVGLPWALVLKCSSNMSMFSSWWVTKWEVETHVAVVRRCCRDLLRCLLTPRIPSSSISLKTVPVTWLGFRACQFNSGILNLVWMGFLFFIPEDGREFKSDFDIQCHCSFKQQMDQTFIALFSTSPVNQRTLIPPFTHCRVAAAM